MPHQFLQNIFIQKFVTIYTKVCDYIITHVQNK